MYMHNYIHLSHGDYQLVLKMQKNFKINSWK